MERKLAFLYTLLVILSFALTECAPTIGNRVDPSSVRFAVGITHKNEIAEKLGLPAQIKRMSDEGSEVWVYDERPELTGVIVPQFTGLDPSTRKISKDSFKMTAAPIQKTDDEINGSGFVFRFDEKGILTEVKRILPEGETK